MNLDPHQIEERLTARLQEDIECVAVASADRRIGCLTPLEYPNGDNVAVWARVRGDLIEVTDFGAATPELPNGGRLRRALDESAALLARGQGVRYANGRISAECTDAADIAECVWSVASASAQVAQYLSALRKRFGQGESEQVFVSEVETALRRRHIEVDRGHAVEGKSGHVYKAKIFVPSVEAILEPVGSHPNQVSAAYRKLGDVHSSNGYSLYSVFDDRREPPAADIMNLLRQVSSVVEWSLRDEWISQLG